MAAKTPTSRPCVASSSAKSPAAVRPSGSFSSHEKPRTIGTSTAISAIITSAMPSTPSAKWAPNAGIQSIDDSSWNRVPDDAAAVE